MPTPKTILITGASSGFGLETAQRLLKRGHTVVLGLRGGEERARKLYDEFEGLWGTRLHALDLHLEHSEHAERARTYVEAKLGGRLDALINNAGYGLFGALEDQTLDEIRKQFEVNFFGLVALTKALLPMLRAARGRVISISSAVGFSSLPMYGTYSATKYAIEGLHEALWYDLRPHGVQVALVQPGGFKTEFATRSRFFAAASQSPSSLYHARTKALEKSLLGMQIRLGNPARVARLLVKLVERRSIKLRYPVGLDTWNLVLIRRLVPDYWRVRMTDWVFRLFFLRGA